MELSVRISGWEYTQTKEDSMEFSIKSNLKVPDVLMKYYKVNKNSIDALINNYFYASHPFELNDPFDCFQNLIDYNGTTIETYCRFFCDFGNSNAQTIERLHVENQEYLKDTFKKHWNDYFFSKLGIVSFTDDQLNMLMWAHYSNHNGFLISYDIQFLKNFQGPFPINYVEVAESFNINTNPHLANLYLTNVKSSIWLYEREWRFLIESKETMRTPTKLDLGLKERKANYPKEAVTEIVLGFDFFQYLAFVNGENGYAIYDFSKVTDGKLRVKLLNYAILNEISISLIHIYENLEFKLLKKKITIIKIGCNKFGYKLTPMSSVI